MDFDSYKVDFVPEKRTRFIYLFDKLTSFFIKSRPANIKNPKKIFIIRNDHIGDVVLCSQVFREIKRKYPRSKITALVSPITKPLIEKDKNIDKIFTIGLFWRKKNFKSFFDYLKILKKIKKENFEVGIDLRGSLLNIIFFLWAPGIRKRAAYFNLSGGRAFLTNPIPYRKVKHTIKSVLDLACKTLGIKPKNYWPEIKVDKEDKKEVDRLLKRKKIKKFICICPGASYKAKRWDYENFDKLIKEINSKYKNYKILLVGGEKDKKVINMLMRNKNCMSLINFNLRLLSILFKKSKLVIANDGGPMHISWVSNSNLIALWGPINLSIMRPLKRSIVIHHQKETTKTEKLIELVTVEETMKAVERILNKSKEQKRFYH